MSDIQPHEPSPFVREILADATAEELADAQCHYEGYLDSLIRIYRRLDEAGGLERVRDKTGDRDRLNERHDL